MVTLDDAYFLNLAVEVAAQNVIDGGGPFGAVVVSLDGSKVFTSGNRVTANNDPTAHAEVSVIRKACASIENFSLEGYILYSSCEPCPMCLGAALWSRVDRIVFAADRYDAAEAGFDDAEFYNKLAVGNVATEQKIDNYLLPFDTWKTNTKRIDY